MDDELVAAGRYARLETRGRRTGLLRAVTVGFVEAEDGSVVVASRPDSAWAANLLDDPRCRVTIGEATWAAVAEPLTGPDFAAAIRDSILRYGTPAEALGLGPAFRLSPTTTAEGDA
jgi:deazaflavin-dependent oxidoreductase (nitroreductase family)